jgi:hypothetical protein
MLPEVAKALCVRSGLQEAAAIADFERQRKLLADVLAETPSPKSHPAFLDMEADHAGRLWLRLPSSTSSVIWRVLSPDGRHIGSVRLASNVQPLDIGESHLIGVERDSLGVETIRVYAFSRRLLPLQNGTTQPTGQLRPIRVSFLQLYP